MTTGKQELKGVKTWMVLEAWLSLCSVLSNLCNFQYQRDVKGWILKNDPFKFPTHLLYF